MESKRIYCLFPTLTTLSLILLIYNYNHTYLLHAKSVMATGILVCALATLVSWALPYGMICTEKELKTAIISAFTYILIAGLNIGALSACVLAAYLLVNLIHQGIAQIILIMGTGFLMIVALLAATIWNHEVVLESLDKLRLQAKRRGNQA